MKFVRLSFIAFLVRIQRYKEEVQEANFSTFFGVAPFVMSPNWRYSDIRNPSESMDMVTNFSYQ